MATFNDTVATIKKTFPKSAAWVKWWMIPMHGSQIFPAMSSVDKSAWQRVPTTNNRIESKNRDMYRCGPWNLPVALSVQAMYLYVKNEER